jgi:hypothetical protein
MAMLSAGGATEFTLRTNNGALVADENTRYITVFSQDLESKLITATVQIQNNTEYDESLTIQAIETAIYFSDSVAPYAGLAGGAFDPSLLFGNGKSVADKTEFEKYCQALPYLGENIYGEGTYFNLFGSQYIKRDSNGGMISTKLSKQIGDSNPDLTIGPGQAVDIAEFYFMPINGTDELDIDMFSYIHDYDQAELIWISPFIATENAYLAASPDGMQPVYISEISAGAFKIHVRRPPPPVYADNNSRTVIGYDGDTMEWSYDKGGPYSSGAPIVKDEAHTIYIRGKGDAGYIGNDALFGDYKKYVPGEALVEFDARAGAADYGAVEAAIAEAEALDRALYTKGSLAALDEAVAAVVYGYGFERQAEVDGFAEAIHAAIEVLIEKAPVTYIQIDAPQLVALPRGSTCTFTVTLNQGASSDDIVWSTSDPSYAAVDNFGTVTVFNKTGTAILLATDPVSGLSSNITLRIV